MTRINKSKYYKKIFSEHKTNSEQTWEAVRSLINVKIKSNKQIVSLDINNQIETNPKAISETFNKFFSLIAKDNIWIPNLGHRYPSWDGIEGLHLSTEMNVTLVSMLIYIPQGRF